MKSCEGPGDCKLKRICKRFGLYEARKELGVNPDALAPVNNVLIDGKYYCQDFIMTEFYGN